MRALAVAGALFASFFATHAAAQNSLLGEGRYFSLAAGMVGESDFSVAFPQNIARDEVELSEAPVFQVAAGARSGAFRLEAAVTHRNVDTRSDLYVGNTNSVVDTETGDVSFTTLDLNVYYDVVTGQPFRPYVGAGLGLAGASWSTGRFEDEDSTLNVQAMAGVSFDISPRASFFVEGRLQRTGDVNVETSIPDANGNTVEGTDEFNFSNAAALAGVRFGF